MVEKQYEDFRVPQEDPRTQVGSLERRWASLALHELGETQERRTSALAAIRQTIIIGGKKLSITCEFDDEFLLRFLRARKFNVKAAYSMLQRYCGVTRRFPQSKRPSELKHVFQQDLASVLKDRDALGRQVFIFRTGKWQPNSCDLWEVFAANLSCLELMVQEPATQVAGLVALVDMADLGIRQARHITPSYAGEVISLIQDCFPLRFKEIHFVNEPCLFSVIFSIVKPFISEKLYNRMFFHGQDLSSLQRQLKCTGLPEEYGGAGGSFTSSTTFAALQELEATSWAIT